MIQLYAAIWIVSEPREIVLILLSVAVAALAAAPSKFQQEIVNILTEGSFEVSRLYLLAGGMIAVILLSFGLEWVLGYRSQILGEDIIRRIRNKLLDGAVDEVRSHSSLRTGTLSTAIWAEAEELGKFTGGSISEPVTQVGTLVSVIAFIISTQPGLGVIALLILVP